MEMGRPGEAKVGTLGEWEAKRSLYDWCKLLCAAIVSIWPASDRRVARIGIIWRRNV